MLGASGAFSVRRDQGLPLPAQPLPAELPQHVAEPISNLGGASVITYLGKGKKNHGGAALRERSEEKCETTSPADTKKEGQEVLQVLKERFTCSPWWGGPWQSRLAPCGPWKTTVEQISTL